MIGSTLARAIRPPDLVCISLIGRRITHRFASSCYGNPIDLGFCHAAILQHRLLRLTFSVGNRGRATLHVGRCHASHGQTDSYAPWWMIIDNSRPARRQVGTSRTTPGLQLSVSVICSRHVDTDEAHLHARRYGWLYTVTMNEQRRKLPQKSGS